MTSLRIVAPASSCPASRISAAEADDDRQDRANADAVAEFEVVAGGVELVCLRQPPQRRRDGEREEQRADPRRTDPPPGADAFLVRLARDADGRGRADVGRQHRRHEQRRPERTAADEEIAAAADEPRRPDAERDDADRVDDEEQQVEVRGEHCVLMLRPPCTLAPRRSTACSPRSTRRPTKSSTSPPALDPHPDRQSARRSLRGLRALHRRRGSQRCGFDVEYIAADGRPEHTARHPRVNVVGARRGRAPRPLVHLNGHFDVVPAGRRLDASIRSAAWCATAASTAAARAT